MVDFCSSSIVLGALVYGLLFCPTIAPQEEGLGRINEEDSCQAGSSSVDCSFGGRSTDSFDDSKGNDNRAENDDTKRGKPRGKNYVLHDTGGASIFKSLFNGWSDVKRGLSTAVGQVYESAKDTGDKIYTTIRDSTIELIEAVRKVLREEFSYYYLMETALSNARDTALAPGTTLHTVVTYFWSILLLLICLSLNYLFLYIFPVLFILGFDGLILLLHYWIESETILYHMYLSFIVLGQWMYFFVIKHPYISCIIVVILCILSILSFVYSWCIRPFLDCLERRNEQRRRRALASGMIDLNDKFDAISKKIEKLEDHIRDVDSKIDAILELLQAG